MQLVYRYVTFANHHHLPLLGSHVKEVQHNECLMSRYVIVALAGLAPTLPGGVRLITWTIPAVINRCFDCSVVTSGLGFRLGTWTVIMDGCHQSHVINRSSSADGLF
jgi:hypothetical protein